MTCRSLGKGDVSYAEHEGTLQRIDSKSPAELPSHMRLLQLVIACHARKAASHFQTPQFQDFAQPPGDASRIYSNLGTTTTEFPKKTNVIMFVSVAAETSVSSVCLSAIKPGVLLDSFCEQIDYSRRDETFRMPGQYPISFDGTRKFPPGILVLQSPSPEHGRLIYA